jgi:predicted N-acetyltransferase YhbS
LDIRYGIEDNLTPAEFVDILERSGLAARRPVDEPERIRAMVENASLTVCARDDRGVLVGVSRAVTDFAFCCYLSDIAVDRALQGRGIGGELIRRTHEAAGGESVTLLLLSAPAAMAYYPKVGLTRLENCFGTVRRTGERPDTPKPKTN